MKKVLYTDLENFKKEVAPYFVKKGITPMDYSNYGLEIKGEIQAGKSLVKVSLEMDNGLRSDLEKLMKSPNYDFKKGPNGTGTGHYVGESQPQERFKE